MLLSISTTHCPATDLGFLLHKHPGRFHGFDLAYGPARVFFPEATNERCTACLLLEIDPVGLVRGRRGTSPGLEQYVSDRPYVASSLLSVAIAQVFGTAMQGRSKERPDLAAQPIPLLARIEVLPARGGESLLHQVFQPLGYAVQTRRLVLDEQFPDWGDSPYYTVEIEQVVTLAELLTHLYVLLPVFDNQKHYYVGDDELEKLLAKGQGWLAAHPLKDEIARRFLRHRSGLVREALSRLTEDAPPDDDPADIDTGVVLGDTHDAAQLSRSDDGQEPLPSLNEQRLGAVMAALRGCGARRVLDLGCGEGKLLRALLADRQFERIVGLDVSYRALEVARERLRLDRLPAARAEKVELLQGSLNYRDRRIEGFDAAAVVEVIEHLDPPRLAAFERVLFEFARPTTVVLTTPNREYNVTWPTLPAGRLRHADHRFEWTRAEFQSWATDVSQRFGYNVTILPVGTVDPTVGPPTQMGVFSR